MMAGQSKNDQKTWYKDPKIVIPMVIALLGGVPGGIAIYMYFFGKPRIIGSFTQCTVSAIPLNNRNSSGYQSKIFVRANLLNEGEVTLSAQRFRCNIRFEDKEENFKIIVQPEGYFDKNDSLYLRNKEFENLQEERTIEPHKTIYGDFIFVSTFSPDELYVALRDKKTKIILTCENIDGKTVPIPVHIVPPEVKVIEYQVISRQPRDSNTSSYQYTVGDGVTHKDTVKVSISFDTSKSAKK
jgi:hypothetical protein